MTVYLTGHVKRDPLTGTTATRTVFPEANPALTSRAWALSSPRPPKVGPGWAGTAEVDSWDDLYTPPEDES